MGKKNINEFSRTSRRREARPQDSEYTAEKRMKPKTKPRDREYTNQTKYLYGKDWIPEEDFEHATDE